MKNEEKSGELEGPKEIAKERPKYISPKITSYTSEEILEEIGPAQACSPSPCPTFP